MNGAGLMGRTEWAVLAGDNAIEHCHVAAFLSLKKAIHISLVTVLTDSLKPISFELAIRVESFVKITSNIRVNNRRMWKQ